MLPILRSAGLLASDDFHSYHCDCSNCDPDDGYPLRAQNDSSCSGELISRVYGTRAHPSTDAYAVMREVQNAAVDADAVPGLRSGFHVHVSASRLTRSDRADVLWQWLRWEPTMEAIASGPFAQMRDFNYRNRNYALDSLAYVHDAPYDMRYRNWSWDQAWSHWLSAVDGPELEGMQERLLDHTCESDRHSLLATYTRYDTFEFRLWNSTRSAWRMELYARLSCAWMKPRITASLADLSPRSSAFPEENMRLFLTALDNAGEDQRTLELLERQIAWLTSGRAQYEPVFTA